MNPTRIISSALIALAILLAAIRLSGSWSKSHQSFQNISVTGLGTCDFNSDLIVWRADYVRNAKSLAEANKMMSADHAAITKFLSDQGISEKSISFSGIRVNRNYKTVYNQQGNVSGSEFDGYSLSQTVLVESQEIEKVEKMSAGISALIEQGIECIAQEPDYYYTKLKDLKIELLRQATADAYERAKTIAGNAGSRLGKLSNAGMGIFQITGQNSNEDYSWGGSFNTKARNKSASITVKLEFEL
ncbi:MAG TPA: SIMPL domain-containing protein [Bacteroidia bacterium]|nr:SIMPL domain-containing protein [Bacteroidia bacterium]